MKQTLKVLLQKFEYFLNMSIFNFACFFWPTLYTRLNVLKQKLWDIEAQK